MKILYTVILIVTIELQSNIYFAQEVLSYETNEIIEKPNSWLKSAQNMFSSPAGHVVVQVAKELLNRSTGNSQVLSLNLTNLLIIILLKMLIFAAGLFGAGHWGYYGYPRTNGRSENQEFGLFEEGEDFLITGFLTAQGTGMDDCLYEAACLNPTIAYGYAKAAKALVEGIEKFEGYHLQNPRYKDLIGLLEKGAYNGYRGIECNTTTTKCQS